MSSAAYPQPEPVGAVVGVRDASLREARAGVVFSLCMVAALVVVSPHLNVLAVLATGEVVTSVYAAGRAVLTFRGRLDDAEPLARDDRLLRRLLRCDRRLPVRLLAAQAPTEARRGAAPAAGRRRGARPPAAASRRRGRILLMPALFVGAAWLLSAFEHAPFAWGLCVGATLFGTGVASGLVDLWAVRRWERQNGRVLTSLLLGDGDVFYVERGVPAA